ncbi:MAG: hypothetical protein ABI747_01240 [Candidatus Moraniibacteriota bacterium]
MKKILVIGCSGTGKSTFSQKLQAKLGIPLIHLDHQYWKPGWVRPDETEWEKHVQDLLQEEKWIMDGNYSGTFDLRIPAADSVILLDRSRWLCAYRVVKRAFQGRTEPEIPSCSERVSFELLRWILWRYPRRSRKKILEMLEGLRVEKKIFILKSEKEVEQFLAE